MTNYDWDCEKDEDKHYDDGTQWTLICELSPALFPPYPDDASYQWNGWQWGSPQLYNGVQHTKHNAVSNDEEAATLQCRLHSLMYKNIELLKRALLAKDTIQ